MQAYNHDAKLHHAGHSLLSLGHTRYRLTIFALLLFGVSLLSSNRLAADTLETIDALSQEQFITFSQNMSAASNYRSLAPPEALGLLGFDVGLALSSTEVDRDLFDLVSDGDFPVSELILPRLQVNKGLPFGFDIGASVSALAETDATVVGAEVRYSIVKGGVLTPNVAVRLSHSRLQGLDDLGMRSTGIELGISKGFLFLTPYANIGIIRSTSDPLEIDSLSSETYDQNKLTVGATFNFGFALTLEADRTGDFRTYAAKVGIRF